MLTTRTKKRAGLLVSGATLLGLVTFALPATTASAATCSPVNTTKPSQIHVSQDYVNGTAVGTSFGSSVTQGSSVEVNLRVSTCTHVTLISYTAPMATWNNGADTPQQAYQIETVILNPGTSTQLQVAVPNCYFQVDLVVGPPIQPTLSTTFYGSHLKDTATGGTNACA